MNSCPRNSNFRLCRPRSRRRRKRRWARPTESTFLREQLKAIQTELGEIDEKTKEIDEFREKIAKAKIPKEVEKEAEKQLSRLGQMHPDAAEASIIRTYLDWIVELPWSKGTRDKLDIKNPKTILDEDHYNLEKVKDRILEYLGVRTPTRTRSGTTSTCSRTSPTGSTTPTRATSSSRPTTAGSTAPPAAGPGRARSAASPTASPRAGTSARTASATSGCTRPSGASACRRRGRTG